MKENYTPGEGCECHAHSESECGCDVDWTPREVYELREQRDRLAEALQKFEGRLDCYGCVGTAEQALAAVKGGSHDH